jgi:isopentenyl-diphosphate delta-isomerase
MRVFYFISDAMDYVILVDEKDREIGVEEKMRAHEKGLLHRAFSILILNSKCQMLLQKRASSKYHSGGLWTNACCSHPRPGEEIDEAVHRRLKEEMGFDCELKEIGSFIYRASFKNGLTEHEYDHVFLGFYDGDVQINKEEADDYKWIELKELRDDIKKNPDAYTFWFKEIMKKMSRKIGIACKKMRRGTKS